MDDRCYTNSDALCEYISQKTNGRTLLSFSGGKGSIGAWIQLKRYFNEIVPVYMYLIPGLSFVEDDLKYYEDVFQTKIYRLPHPSLYRWLYYAVAQPPENIKPLVERGITMFDYVDISDLVKLHLGWDVNAVYTATGVRAVDSPYRWTAIKRHGPVNENTLTYYPIFDWRKGRLIDEIRSAGIRLGKQYRLFGRTFDGLDYRFLKPIRDYYPDDYKKILEMFPMAELNIKRMEYRYNYYAKIGVAMSRAYRTLVRGGININDVDDSGDV